VDHTVEQALRAVGLYLGARHGYLAVLDDGNRTLIARHAWASSGHPNALGRVIDLVRVDQLPTELHRGETCILEAGAPGFEALAERQDRTVAVSPVMRDEALRGMLVFGSDRAEPPWDAESDALLLVVAEVLSAGIERRRLIVSLAEARDEALESSRLKSEFLATMGHEIRTPIHGIIGMSEMLMDSLPEEEPQAWAQTILDEGTRLKVMMGAILDYAQLEAGKLVFAREPYHPRKLLQDLRDQMVREAQRKGLYLDLDIGSEVPDQLVGDARRIGEAVRELLDNAIKFTDQGGVTLRAQYGEDAGGPPALTIVVSDTGIGIPYDMQETIFDAFRQVDGSTTRRHGGMGLGLTLARGLVEAMGGSIELDSSPGQGASFRLRVPSSTGMQEP
jgi:two-component system, sensor histidine kinase and response regulator